jgi:hypothetical protein
MKNVIFAIFAVAMLASCSQSTETTSTDSVAVDSLTVDSTVVEGKDTTFSSEEMKDTLK